MVFKIIAVYACMRDKNSHALNYSSHETDSLYSFMHFKLNCDESNMSKTQYTLSAVLKIRNGIRDRNCTKNCYKLL